MKRAANGNHFVVLTEGKRDEKTNELRKSMVFVYSEDFPAFFQLVKATAEFCKANPVPGRGEGEAGQGLGQGGQGRPHSGRRNRSRRPLI